MLVSWHETIPALKRLNPKAMKPPNTKQARNLKEFLELYKNHVEPIKKYIFYKVGNRMVAEDLEQETFLRIWRHMKKSKENIRNSKNFAYRVAGNLIIDYYRQKAKTEIPLEDIPEHKTRTEATQPKKIDSELARKIFEKNIDKIEDKYKKILVLRYIHGASIDEVCRITGKSPNYISVLTHKGIKQLKQKIADPKTGRS